MKKTLLKAIAVYFVFFIGASCLVMVDTVCEETTGEGGKLVLDVSTVFENVLKI